MTDIHISQRHDSVPEDLEAFVRDKVGRLGKYLKDSSRVEVILDRDHQEHKCEILLHAARRGGQHVVKEAAPDYRSCVDLAVDKLEAQLRKHKDRRKDHHRGRGRDGVPPAGPEAAPPDEPSYEDIVHRDIKGE